jgi:hypothetical protein
MIKGWMNHFSALKKIKKKTKKSLDIFFFALSII